MRDIAEQLAFLAIQELCGDYEWTGSKAQLRVRMADKFEELLDNLPEGTFVKPDAYPDNVKVSPVHPDQIRFGLAFRVTFKDWPHRHYMARDVYEIAALIDKYNAGEIKE